MIKCDQRAKAKCPFKKPCCGDEVAYFVEGSECDKLNQKVLSQRPTNADRIRAMSDEELCLFLMEAPAVPCDEKISSMMKKNGCDDCQSCIKEWLQQPVEGE